MIYPENFERKIGFNDIRTQLKGRCMSTLGTEWVDNRLTFMTDYEDILEAQERAGEFARFMEEEDDIYENNFFDVRQPLLRIRPERTYMEELDLFDLKRSLKTISDLVGFFTRPADEDGRDTTTAADEDGNYASTRKNDSGRDNAEATPYPALRRMAESVTAFPEIVKKIDAILNKYGKVKDTASSELLSVRHSIEVTTRGISHTLRNIITEAQNEGYIERDVSPTLRDGRLVIPVAPALKRKIKGIIHDESATGKTIFIEPSAVVDANNRIRELKAAEKREVIRILQELTQQIRPHVPEILSSLQFLAHIDYLRALATFSVTFDAIAPRLVDAPHLDWSQARHPLLQQSLERHGRKMVPLDITLRKGERILLISGPNAGGKSVCLKTVGLLQYMLQCGMPVPMRENSTAGIFNHIFIDIGDEQSIEDDLSTYSSHLTNMKQMMKNCDRRSLLLIDEFGGGTEPQIGGAMAEAILHKFVEKETYGIITTHYQNLKLYGQACPSIVNGAMLYDRGQMQPLFILQTGNPGSSFAIEIARKIGIPEDVIAHASELVGKDYVMSDKYLQDIVRDKMYWENKRRNIHHREKQLEETVTRYETEMEQFQQEKKGIIAKAKTDAEALLKESNAIIENTIRTIREAQADKERTRAVRNELSAFKEQLSSRPETEDEIARKIAKIKRRQERKKNNKGKGPVGGTTGGNLQTSENGTAPRQENGGKMSPITPGCHVRIKGQDTIGKVDSINGKTARVLFGMMYTNIATDRLEKATPPPTDNISKAATFISRETRDAMYEKKLHFKPEIDLRGMRAEEALTATSYFIDDAIQLEQSRVRILHGTGTGVLRELIRNYLATVPGVRAYHDEHVQFGGAGITIAELE